MRSITIYFLACTIAYWAGALSTTPPTKTEPPQRRITPTLVTVTGAQSVKAYPLDIKLRIVNAKEFDNSYNVAALKINQKMEGVGAYTIISNNPCEIVIPDNFEIDVIASRGYAWFSSDTGDILAHEILHCLYGAWHQPWNKIESQSKIALPKADALPPSTKRITSGLMTLPPPTKPETWLTR